MTSKDAAKILGITPQRIVVMIHSGILKATKRGRDWWIDAESVKAAKGRKPGRPRKGKA